MHSLELCKVRMDPQLSAIRERSSADWVSASVPDVAQFLFFNHLFRCFFFSLEQSVPFKGKFCKLKTFWNFWNGPTENMMRIHTFSKNTDRRSEGAPSTARSEQHRPVDN